MKFTETEFKKIVDIWENGVTFTGLVESVLEFVMKEYGVTSPETRQRAIALAMPETREWAREQFVEKEKKRVYVSKAKDVDGNHTTLFIDEDNMVQTVAVTDADEALETKNKAHYLFETQIREWGFDPAGFVSKEVK